MTTSNLCGNEHVVHRNEVGTSYEDEVKVMCGDKVLAWRWFSPKADPELVRIWLDLQLSLHANALQAREIQRLVGQLEPADDH